MAMRDWLRRLGMEQHAAAFEDNDIDLATLPHLTDEDLRELGLSLGHRRKLMAAVRELPAPGPERTGGPTPERESGWQDEAERRQLTVLFCDLAGSTRLSHVLDAEDLRQVLQAFHQAVASAVTAEQGHVAKLLGDGLLAYFGWPTAHEAQTESALRAALAAVDRVRRIEAVGEPLLARAGVATGPVVIGTMSGPAAREEGSVAGATPNLAARLQEVAQPGEVVTDAATRRLVGRSFRMEDAGALELKGFPDPVPVWRVRGEARSSSRFEALQERALTGFIGRQSETGRLRSLWQQACSGAGRVALVSGEPGIGKSRMLREAEAILEPAPQHVLRLQCSPHEINTAFYPLIAEMEETVGLGAERPAEERLDRLRRHLSSCLGDDLHALPLLADLLSLQGAGVTSVRMTPQRRKQETVAALTERILRLARPGPALLLVEDVHWSDASTLDVLDALLGRLAGLPALCIMTFRPEFDPPWREQDHVAAFPLDRLEAKEGRKIASRVAGGKALPEALLSRIVAQTDGVPLFVEELTKAVLEGGLLEEREDHYRIRGPLSALALPSSLQDSLMARLDRLAPVKRVIQAASCIGREFGADLVAAALPMERAELEPALQQLVAAELIFPLEGNGQVRFVFKHALVQDAAYFSLLRSARQTFHARLARALEAAEEPDPLELARHFAGAGLHERAAALYLDAGRRALATSALPEAIGALELGLQAAETLPRPDRDRLELGLRVALGAARMANFGWAHSSVASALEPAFPLAQEAGDGEALGSILWGLWVHYQTRTDFPRAHRWLDELEKAAGSADGGDLPVMFAMSAGCQHFWEADYASAIDHTERLRKIYVPERHGRLAALTNHDPLVFAQHWAGSLADWIRGYPEQSLERMEEAVGMARALGHPFNLVFALTAGSTCLIYLDLTDRLLEQCAEAETVATEEALGPFSEHVTVMQWRGGALVQRGEFEQGHALVERGYRHWNGSEGRICTAMFRSWIAMGLDGLGRSDAAAELNRANIAHCRETGDRYMEPECLRLQGEFALRTSADSTAERLFHEALALARAHGAGSWELRAATSLARLLLHLDRRHDAAGVLEPVLSGFSEGRATADVLEAERVLQSACS